MSNKNILLSQREIHFCSCFGLCIALASDLHGIDPSDAIALLKKRKPNIIASPGDIFEMRPGLSDEDKFAINKNGFEFLRMASDIAPTFFSKGNHDAFPSDAEKAGIIATGAAFLDNSYAVCKEINIGGLSSGGSNRYFKKTYDPDKSFIDSFASLDGFKLLLNHHPEYYDEYIKPYNIDLTFSGHAHGGQWRFFGRGLFAPGQGLFPKYTSGLYDGRLIVSRGLGGLTSIPRINNSPEIIFVNI